MIARVARFSFPSLKHREEAEHNGSERVGPSLARQPGFQAIYFGRVAELEAVSISMFDSLEMAEAAAGTMNAEPLLAGQVPGLLPTPTSVSFYEVMEAAAHDRVPAVGRLGYLAVAPGLDAATAATWARRFNSMLADVPGLAQAFLLRTSQGDERIALTFWVSRDAMEAGGGGIGAWHAAEIAAGRRPAMVATETVLLTDLRFLLRGVPTTVPM